MPCKINAVGSVTLSGENVICLRTAQGDSFIIRPSGTEPKIRTYIMISGADEAECAAKAEVFLDPDQVSLAIGKGGLNIKLASMLVGYTIDVFREVAGDADDEDVSLDEFTDAIEPWIIDELKKIGFQTARGVLNAQRDMIVQNADLEEETVDEVLRILQAEFE